jgi:YVTN family beta-propeller protein
VASPGAGLTAGAAPLAAGGAQAAATPAAAAGRAVAVGSLPTGVAATDTTAYVANSDSNTVSVVDLANPAAAPTTIAVGQFPEGVALSPDGSMAYVTNFHGGSLSIIDTATDAVIHTVPVGTDPDGVVQMGASVYVANLLSGTISIVDPSTGTVTGTIALGGTSAPSGLADAGDGVHLLVDDAGTARTDVFDVSGPSPVFDGSAAVGTFPAYLADNDGAVYVANPSQAGTVSVVDVNNPASPTVTATIGVGSHPYGVALLPVLGDVLVTNSGSGTVSVIDDATNTVTSTLTVGRTPDAIAVTPDQTTVVVTDEGDDTLSILHVNQPPVNTVSGPQTVSENATAANDNTVVFSSANGSAISTSDPDAGANPEQVTLAAAHGALTLPETAGLSFSAGSNGSGSMTFTGSIADIDAGLAGLTYKPAVGFVGLDTLSMSVDDLGNSGDLGVPETATSVVDITVLGVLSVGNVSFTGAVGNTVFGVGTSPPQPSTSSSGSVLSNSTDPGATLTAVAGTLATANGGTVSLNADGTFTYHPPAGFTGSDTFSFQVTNGHTTASAVATIVVAGRVWYVNDAAAANGSGTSTSPFNALSAVTGPGGPTATGDDIFLFDSPTPYGGGIVLKADQLLIGQSQTLTVDGELVSTGAGTNPTITNGGGVGIALGEGDTVTGITVSGTSAAGVSANALNAFTLSPSDTITNAGADGLDVTGGSGTITAGAAISGAARHSVDVSGRTGGTMTVSGAVHDTGTGVLLSSNSGAEIDFTGGLAASSGVNPAFQATGGGTIDVTGAANTLATTTADALNVVNTAIGAGGLTFQSITAGTSAAGPSDGISLQNTGAGALTVTGTGAVPGSGGTIQHATDTTSYGGDVSLRTAGSVSLSNMLIETPAGDGVGGEELTSLTLVGNTISGAGANDVNDNLGGVSSTTDTHGGRFYIAGNTLTGSTDSAIHLDFASEGTVTGFVTGNTIGNPSLANPATNGSTGGEGIDLYSTGDGGTVTASITNNTITGIAQQFGILAAALDQATEPSAPTLNLTLTGNAVKLVSDAAQDGINVASGEAARAVVCLNATGNTSQSDGLAADSPTQVDADGMSVYQDTSTSVFAIVGGPVENEGVSVEDTHVESFLNARNTLAAGPGATSEPSFATQFGGAGFTSAASCPTAPAPAAARAASTRADLALAATRRTAVRRAADRAKRHRGARPRRRSGRRRARDHRLAIARRHAALRHALAALRRSRDTGGRT